MTRLVLEVEDLSKEYKLGLMNAKTFKESITNYVSNRNQKNSNKFLWALNGVSFKLNEGEVLGIIGHNGAGKSTLLKLISQISKPSKGQVKIRGQIASLLEVGTGFHNELTGRENIFMNGAILGMNRKEIRKVIDQIIEFSEIKLNLIDTPIKKYSSGMKVRLAFAVAVHLNATILLMDEVLAVSDFRFQEKSLKKLKELVANGKAIIYVSHDLESIKTICNKCILLDKGRLIAEGKPNDVIKTYLEKSASFDNGHSGENFNLGIIQFSSIFIYPEGREDVKIDVGESICVSFNYSVDKMSLKKNGKLQLEIQCKTEDGTLLFTSEKNEIPLPYILKGKITLCTSPLNLLRGTYYLSIIVTYRKIKHKIEKFAKFEITPNSENALLKKGLIKVDSFWENSISNLKVNRNAE